MQTTTIVAIMLKIWMVHSRNVIGRRSSIISISLEKRFIILPIGVVSKKDIGDRSMLSSIRLWSLADAATILVRAKYPNVNIAKPEIKKRNLYEDNKHPVSKFCIVEQYKGGNGKRSRNLRHINVAATSWLCV